MILTERRNMLGEERQQAILAAVEQRHSVSVQELMQLLDISESTIRRDLNALDKEGRLVKVMAVRWQSEEVFM